MWHTGFNQQFHKNCFYKSLQAHTDPFINSYKKSLALSVQGSIICFDVIRLGTETPDGKVLLDL